MHVSSSESNCLLFVLTFSYTSLEAEDCKVDLVTVWANLSEIFALTDFERVTSRLSYLLSLRDLLSLDQEIRCRVLSIWVLL